MRARRSEPSGDTDIDRTPSSERSAESESQADHQPHRLLRLQQSIGNHAVQRMQAAGSPAVVQLQPDPIDSGPIGDPTEFIESQLARRFTDPEDPRLAV